MEDCQGVTAVMPLGWKFNSCKDGLCTVARQRIAYADVCDFGVWKKDEIELISSKCLKWLKVGLHFLWDQCLSYPRPNISEDTNSSWLKTEVIWKYDASFSPKDLSTVRQNSLYQRTLDVDSVNCFKNHLQCSRNTLKGFFVDWFVRLTHWLHNFIVVWPHQVNNQQM